MVRVPPSVFTRMCSKIILPCGLLNSRISLIISGVNRAPFNEYGPTRSLPFGNMLKVNSITSIVGDDVVNAVFASTSALVTTIGSGPVGPFGCRFP